MPLSHHNSMASPVPHPGFSTLVVFGTVQSIDDYWAALTLRSCRMPRILASTWQRIDSLTPGRTAARSASASKWGASPGVPLPAALPLLPPLLLHLSTWSAMAACTSARNAPGAGGPVGAGGAAGEHRTELRATTHVRPLCWPSPQPLASLFLMPLDSLIPPILFFTGRSGQCC